MQIYQGVSTATDGSLAVSEATADWGTEPQMVLAFVSTAQDAGDVAAALAHKFPHSHIVGCTTAGEHLSGRHLHGSLVLTGIDSEDLTWSTALLTDLDHLDESRVSRTVEQMLHELDIYKYTQLDRCFCLSFIDGLSMKEEVTSALIADALQGVPLLGGSAGDDVKFEKTEVIHNSLACSDAVVLTIAHSRVPFKVLKHQHFTTTPISLVVTEVDTAARRVYELDGYPALSAYAHAIGLNPEQVTEEVILKNPVTFSCNGEIYVRSIQEVMPDGSLIFYCGVEEGMVLEIGAHNHMSTSLKTELDNLADNFGPIDFLLMCNCVLRAQEADSEDSHDQLGDILSETCRTSIGFDTYGEQLNGLHINQTMVALALRDG
ncbi:FIST N-terminal domain-containing protein [Aeoliella mucimassa]|uniref:FIST N domain protein n=1 Tax=Aeoliella mucimassa TaxID=2527972 RepID=A0A518AKK2_9BACT|nr:FIST N-terminal domain-containing protein [Aeoliella mucimassa]QDU55268.1 FIST N domain protein [Aeoliella mucimassa]